MSELLNYGDVAGICKDQGVRLHNRIVKAGIDGIRSSKGVAYAPSNLQKALNEAGGLLKTYGRTELADGPLEVSPEEDMGLVPRTLINMLNDSLVPFETDDDAVVLESDTDNKRVDACRGAEDCFMKTIVSLKSADSESVQRHGCNVITDDNGRPIFISKSEGVRSSLSLQDVVVNGVRIPAGSIMRVRLKQDGFPVRVNPRRIGLYSLRDVETASFARLSGFAFGISERREELPAVLDDMSQQRRRLFNRTSLGEVAMQVEAALERIGLAAA